MGYGRGVQSSLQARLVAGEGGVGQGLGSLRVKKRSSTIRTRFLPRFFRKCALRLRLDFLCWKPCRNYAFILLGR